MSDYEDIIDKLDDEIKDAKREIEKMQWNKRSAFRNEDKTVYDRNIQALENKIQSYENKKLELMGQKPKTGNTFAQNVLVGGASALAGGLLGTYLTKKGVFNKKETAKPTNNQTKAEENLSCSSCGTPLKPGKKFCANCGTPAPEEKVEKTCPTCGDHVDADESFCENCGTNLKEKVCACGHKNKPDTKFCKNCGQKF